jgi:hypothetical protein
MNATVITAALVWLVALLVLPLVPRESVWLLTGTFTVAFAAFVLLHHYGKQLPFQWLLLLAVAARLATFVAPPQLSDDYFRFLWDGRLVASGQSPYTHTPEACAALPSSPDPSGTLLARMNSPAYYSVYPPVAQYVWGLCALLANGKPALECALIRLMVLLAELATLFMLRHLLKRLQLPPHAWMLYALNPLIIAELCGNLHPEAFMVCFLVAAACLYREGRTRFAGVAFGMAVMCKLLPLMLLPVIWKYLGHRRFFSFVASALSTSLLCLPLADPAAAAHVFDSLSLYIVNFEFNAAFYALLKPMAQLLSHEDPVRWLAPLLSASGALLMVWWVFRSPTSASPAYLMLTCWLIYLLTSTTIHPWYLAVPVLLSVGCTSRFALVWSGLVVLSYAHYAATGLPWQLAEYGALAVYAAVMLYRRTRHDGRAGMSARPA